MEAERMGLYASVDALVAQFGREAVRRALEDRVASDQVTVVFTGEDPPPPAPRAPSPLPERYEDLGLIATGGMGEVRRVRDRELGRVAAMKLVFGHLLGRRGAVRRFEAEARVAAQLQHPGLVPVYDAGRLDDGRLWFTMREVRGRTLTEAIDEVHDASAHGAWLAGSSGWGLHRLIDAFAKICDAVGYAHSRGVLHRDLKPDNVMIGAHGEVLVLDWGIAKVLGRTDDDPDPVAVAGPSATSAGSLAGTASYMSPEQARGEVDRLDPRTDVYGLGAILFQILTGRAPFTGRSLMHVLVQVMAGPPRVRASESAHPLPDELVRLCERAMALEMGDRHPNGEAVAADARAWLDGSRRRERALGVVEESRGAQAAAVELRHRAAAARVEARALLAGRHPYEPEEAKAPGWAKEDLAAALERQADLEEQRAEVLLSGALQHDPGLPEAHSALVSRLRAAHQEAEEAGDADLAARLELRLRAQASALGVDHPSRRSAEAWLQGDGALTLSTDPPGAEVELWRFEVVHRRLVAVPWRSLGRTPLRAVGLPMGSYLCVVRHPERAPVRYPVHVARGEHWDGIPPGGREPLPIPLPRPSDLGPLDHYVPPGWFRAGDRRFGDDNPPQRVWCDGFVARRFPVTNAEHLRFLDGLVAAGREDEALRCVPRERAGSAGEEGAPIYGRATDGRFVLRADGDGDTWDPEWPVVLVDWTCADRHATAAAERDGLPWRLPAELEWEKAARGVDGRKHPWGGEAFDPSWCCTRDSHRGRALLARVDSFPVDESPYGVRGCAGNTRDWCLDPYVRPVRAPGARVVVERGSAAEGTAGVVRGGVWNGADWTSKVAWRGRFSPGERNAGLGFRLVRSWPSR